MSCWKKYITYTYIYSTKKTENIQIAHSQGELSPYEYGLFCGKLSQINYERRSMSFTVKYFRQSMSDTKKWLENISDIANKLLPTV